MHYIETLQPVNSRLKRLIHDHGKEWKIIRGPIAMPCFNGDLGVCLQSITNPEKVSNVRWTDLGGLQPCKF